MSHAQGWVFGVLHQPTTTITAIRTHLKRGRRKHYLLGETFRRSSSFAVPTSREGHHWPKLNLEVPYRRWEWALRRAHWELSWWSLRSLIRLSWFPGTAMYISGTNALRFWSLRPTRFASAKKPLGANGDARDEGI